MAIVVVDSIDRAQIVNHVIIDLHQSGGNKQPHDDQDQDQDDGAAE